MADTKRTILAAIRDQIRPVVGKTPGSPRWSPQHWWEAFQYLFIYSSGVSEQHQDDLLFFVRRASAAGSTALPFFVRRRMARLPEELQLSGKDFSSVDWEATVILNIVLQSQYQLTVVACGREALPFVAEGRTWTADMRTVTKPVFASATETAVNLDSSRASASNPAACYPDVCFAVEDFEDAFGEMVLQEAEQCYCVVLHAILSEGATAPADSGLNGLTAGSEGGPSAAFLADCHAAATAEQQGAAARGGTAAPGAEGRPAHQATAADADTGTPQGSEGSMANWTIGTRKRTLFAGFVSHQQIHEFIHSSSSNSKGQAGLLGSMLAQVAKPAKDKVVMTGPGGMGRAEVAITKLQRTNSMPGTGSVSSDGSGRPDPSTGSAAAAAAAGPQPPVVAAAAAGGGSPGGQVIPPIYKEPSGLGGTASSSSGSLGQASTAATGSSSDTGDPRRLSGGGQGGGLLSRSISRARQVASGLQRLVADIQGGGLSANSNLRCALMMLKLPVQTVAREILEGL